MRTEALETFAEQHRLKDREKDKMITDLHKVLEDAKRRAEQGSSETQGKCSNSIWKKHCAARFRWMMPNRFRKESEAPTLFIM